MNRSDKNREINRLHRPIVGHRIRFSLKRWSFRISQVKLESYQLVKGASLAVAAFVAVLPFLWVINLSLRSDGDPLKIGAREVKAVKSGVAPRTPIRVGVEAVSGPTRGIGIGLDNVNLSQSEREQAIFDLEQLGWEVDIVPAGENVPSRSKGSPTS